MGCGYYKKTSNIDSHTDVLTNIEEPIEEQYNTEENIEFCKLNSIPKRNTDYNTSPDINPVKNKMSSIILNEEDKKTEILQPNDNVYNEEQGKLLYYTYNLYII